MPLNIIPYQPLYANQRPTDCFGCGSDYCIPFQPGDPVRAQYQQTPCAPSITCDGDFSAIGGGSEVLPDGDFNALGAEELINGNFTTDANNWTLGADWSWNAGGGNGFVEKAAGSLQTAVTQLLANTLPGNAIYRVVFTVAGRTQGSIQAVFAGGATQNFGAAISSNSTFTQYIKVAAGTTTFGFTGTALFDGEIDTVSVKRIAASWDFGVANNDIDFGWTINSTTAFAENNANAALTCAGVIVPNTNYDVTVEVASGTNLIRFDLGGNMTPYYVISGAVTINFQIQSGAGTDFRVLADALLLAFVGEIESISIIEIDDDCWDYDATLWNLTGGAICKTPGTSDILTNSAPMLDGVYYQVKITVSNRTAGFIQASVNGQTMVHYVNGVAVTNITTNGTTIMYITPTADSTLSIFADAQFDGCISDVEIFELQNDFVFELRDAVTGDLVATISNHDGQAFTFVRYFQDYVTLIFTLDDPLLVDDVADRPIEYGCYKIYSYDNCEVQYEELIGDGEFQNPMNVFWFVESSVPAALTEIITGSRLEVDLPAPDAAPGASFIANNYLGTGIVFYSQNPAIPAGFHNYRLEWDIISSDDPNIKVTVKFGYQRPIASELSTVGSHSITLSYDPAYNTPPRQWLSVLVEYPVGVSGTVIIDNVSAHRIEPFDATYISQCIKYAESFECTKYIKAYSDANQMGFDFENTGFYLGQRIYMRAPNPDYPEDQSDYLYSEGTRAKNFYQTQKNFVIFTGLLPEWTHDSLRIQRGMQHFQIGDTEYFAFEGYKPSWQGNGQFELAVVRFEIAIKDKDTKFFRNT